RPTPSLFVPSGSVGSTTDRTFVVRVRNGRTEWVDVRTGLASGPLMEVFGDLQAGDQVVVRATDEIKPGTEVFVKDGNPAASEIDESLRVLALVRVAGLSPCHAEVLSGDRHVSRTAPLEGIPRRKAGARFQDEPVTGCWPVYGDVRSSVAIVVCG